jgi:hypothetical protein
MRQRMPGIADGDISAPFGDVEGRMTSSRASHAAAKRRQPRTVIVFIWAFLGVGTMICAWSFATPIGAAPDEPAHIVQAAAIVRGQFDEPLHQGSVGRIASVRVPAWVADIQDPCFVKFDAFSRPKQTGVAAACPDTLSHATGPALGLTQFSNAPPLYYLVVGLPSLFLSGPSALYAMRLVGDLLNTGLVALAIWLLIRFYPRRTPLVGVLIALSPMVLFLMAVVSSSGLEISSGFATWCGGLCIVERPQLPRALAIWTAVAAVLLILSRPTSPLDAAIITVVVALLIGWRGLRQRLNPSLVPLWSPVLVAAIVAGGFFVVFGPPHLIGLPPPHPAGLLSNMWTNLRLTGVRLRQCIGDFGWLDTPVPTWVVIVWTPCVAGLTALALTLSAPCRRALPVLALLILAMPEALYAPKMNTIDLNWQGRYWLPVVVGFPLVASTFQWRSRRHRDHRTDRQWVAPALLLGLVLVLFAAQVASFLHALTRYEVGIGVPAGTPITWLPPGGHYLVVVAFVVGAVVTLSLVVFMMWPRMEVDPVSARDLVGSGHSHPGGR